MPEVEQSLRRPRSWKIARRVLLLLAGILIVFSLVGIPQSIISPVRAGGYAYRRRWCGDLHLVSQNLNLVVHGNVEVSERDNESVWCSASRITEHRGGFALILFVPQLRVWHETAPSFVGFEVRLPYPIVAAVGVGLWWVARRLKDSRPGGFPVEPAQRG